MPAPSPSVTPTSQLAKHLNMTYQIIVNSQAFQDRIAEAHASTDYGQFIHCFDDAIAVQDGTLGTPELNPKLKRPFVIVAPATEGQLQRIANCAFPNFEGQSLSIVIVQDVVQESAGEHSFDTALRFLNFAGGVYESVNGSQYAGEVLDCQIINEPMRSSYLDRELNDGSDFYSMAFGIQFGVETNA